MKSFNYYIDPGHGWLAVPLKLIFDLKIAGKITSYSYMKGKTAYLEEDWDMSTFIQAYQEVYGCKPSMQLKNTDKRSPIRSYDPWNYAIASARLYFS